MAQTALPHSPRGRVHSPRSARLRFQLLDFFWLIVLLFTFAAVAFAAQKSLTPALALAGLTIIGTYLVGWRIAGRPCGIAAGLLTATSVSFVLSSASSSTFGGAFAALTVFALFFAVSDMPLAACGCAALAAAARPDGALLGLLLLALTSIRSPKHALPAAGVFFGTAIAGWAVRIALLHDTLPAPVFQSQHALIDWAVSPATLFLLWFLVPFCADCFDSLRGPRWTPVVLWLVADALFASFVCFTGVTETIVALVPIVFIVAAGGLARLLPIIAGDRPTGRYVLATLAVIGLIAIRARSEWPLRLTSPIPAAVTAPVIDLPETPAIVAPAAAVPRIVKRPGLALKKPVVSPRVLAYTMRNGKRVKRSPWAIQWEKTHPPISSSMP